MVEDQPKSIISSFEEKKSGHYAADVLYGFYPAAGLFFFFTLHPTREKNDLVSDNTFFIFSYGKNTKKRKHSHLSLFQGFGT